MVRTTTGVAACSAVLLTLAHVSVVFVFVICAGTSIGGFSAGSVYSENADGFTYTDVLLQHGTSDQLASKGLARTPGAIGDYVTSNIYHSTNASTHSHAQQEPADASAAAAKAGSSSRSSRHGNLKGAPAIVWLHPYSYSTGYSPAYGQTRVHEALAAAGFVVLCFDQLGFGLRLTQGGTSFYARYGAQSSIFGHLVKDAKSAVDFLYCRSSAQSGGGREDPACNTWADSFRRVPTVDFERCGTVTCCTTTAWHCTHAVWALELLAECAWFLG